MTEQTSSSPAERFWALVRGVDVNPDWAMSVVLLVLVGLGAGIAVLLGDMSLAIYTVLPFVGAAIGVAMAGPVAGAAMGAAVVVLMLVSALAAATPLSAALVFGAFVMWLAVPSRYSPGGRSAILLLFVFVFASVFAVQGVGAVDVVLYSGIGALAGFVVGLGLARIRARRVAQGTAPTEQQPTAQEPPPVLERVSPLYYLGVAIAALISGALLYRYLTTETQRALWVFFSFVFVLRPAHSDTVVRSLQRLAGTLAGFAVVVLLSLLPGQVPAALGLVALVPAIAYAQASYAISSAASTVTVVMLYGAPTGAYVAWGIERTADVLVGAALAVGIGVLVRWLNRLADARTR